jgi:ArsR family transcriptional regulator
LRRRDFSKQADLFKVLADPNRLKIFATIARADDDVCVCDLTADLPLEQPTVSHHLRILRESGLLLSERRGTWVYYRLAPGVAAMVHGAVDLVTGAPEVSRRKTTAS